MAQASEGDEGASPGRGAPRERGRPGGPGPAARHDLLAALLVLGVAACNVFLRLGTSGVNDYDEARYGVSAYEMQQSRDLVVTTYAGNKEYWALKPPLGYWLMALSFALFGGSAWAMRLPSALCAVAVVAITMAWAWRRFGPPLAVLAGAIAATAFGYISHHGARSGDFDSCLTFILLLAAVQLPGLGRSPWRIVALAPVLACGFLLKSYAIVPLLLVAAVFTLWTGAWRRQRLVPCLAALSLFAAIVGVWAFARWRADGSSDFFVRMFREDVLERSTSIVDKSTSSPIGYLTSIFDRFAPWPPLMIAAAIFAWRAGRARQDKREGLWERLRHLEGTEATNGWKLLAVWTSLQLVIVSAVRTQHHWYLDPIVPALSILAAASVLFLVARLPDQRRKLGIAALVVLPLALCEGRLLGRILGKEPMSADQRFLSSLKELNPAVRAAGALRSSSPPSSARAALPPRAGASPQPPIDVPIGCRRVFTSCRLLYSERFILEVADGFTVVEPPPGGPPPAPDRLPAGSCLLVGMRDWRRPPPPPAERLPPRDRLVAANESYALYRGVAKL